MPVAALVTTLRILIFRRGPEDLPYAPQAVRFLLPTASLVTWLLFSLVLPPLPAALMAVANVLGTVLAAELILRYRNFRNRVIQTLTALLSTGIVFNILLLWPASVLAPHLIELAKKPDLLKTNYAARLPQGAVFSVDGLNLWAFAVTAFIYRRAAGVRVLGSIGLALLASAVILVLLFVVATIGSTLGH